MAISAQNAIKANEAFKESKFNEALEMYQALLKKSPKKLFLHHKNYFMFSTIRTL